MKSLLTFFFAAISISAAASPLTVKKVGQSPAHYQCKDGTKITANYYELSDKSLQFVKLNSTKLKVTLPLSISGSGSRYSDGYQNEWWIKGNNATLNTDINNKDHQAIECSSSPG